VRRHGRRPTTSRSNLREYQPEKQFPRIEGLVALAGGAAYHLQNVAPLPWYTGASEGLGRIQLS
jgi:hypothetical protein